MLSQEEFLKKYNYTLEKFETTGLKWKMLVEIYDDYVEEIPNLEASAIYIFNSLMKTDKVHSVRYRVKDPEHLIEKIIRKKIKDLTSDITKENYQQKITDLIGVRALHLFKEEWLPLHYSITKTWNLMEQGVINYRKGDDLLPNETLVNLGLERKEHPAAYRSIHYIIETKPAKKHYYAEIQVRTIFEEAWSEIDHSIRYPYDLHNELFNQFLMIFNRLSGSADEMGTYISNLKKHVKATEESHGIALLDKDKTIIELQNKISKLKIEPKDSKLINEQLEKLRNISSSRRNSNSIDVGSIGNMFTSTIPFSSIDFINHLNALSQDTQSFITSGISSLKMQQLINDQVNLKKQSENKLPVVNKSQDKIKDDHNNQNES